MTDTPLVERLRGERDALVRGLSAIIHCQSPLSRKEMREAAAGLLDTSGTKPVWLDGDQSPFVQRALAAEDHAKSLRSPLTTALVAMRLASALPGVSDEFDFSEAITEVETALRALSQEPSLPAGEANG